MELNVSDSPKWIPNSKAHNQQASATCHPEDGHKHPALIAKEIAGGNLLRKRHMFPKKFKAFQ